MPVAQMVVCATMAKFAQQAGSGVAQRYCHSMMNGNRFMQQEIYYECWKVMV